MIKLFRKRKKILSLSLLLVVIQSLIAPYEVFAVSTGPEQVEYASYESADATDMVNLLTGNFSYNIPLLDVPGPEGSFSVPLFYHGGVTVEQDASWAGLGWNVNVGCITRSVVGFHDDAYDAPISVNVNDPGGSGWVKNYVFYKRTWDSQRGYGGGISLLDIVGVEWQNGTGLTSGTLIGLNFNKSGIKGNLCENIINVANVAMTIASFGSGSAATAGSSAVKSAALDIAMDAVMTGAALYQGYLSQGSFTSSYFDWSKQTDVSNLGFRVDYKYWLDDTREERAFGTLYLGSTEKTDLDPVVPAPDYNQLPSYKVGTDYPRQFNVPLALKPVKGFVRDAWGSLVGSDLYLNVSPGESYINVVRPDHLSYDQFSVMTDGVDGNISPYRLEIGSVAQPHRYTHDNRSHNVVPFIEENNSDNKVQFYYPGQFSNKYLYHDDVSFGIDHSTYDAGSNTTYDKQGLRYLTYTMTTDKLLGQRIEDDETRIKNKRLVSGKHIEWYSNEDITAGVAASNGFISAKSRPSGPAKGIGGFSITKEDGTTYHYAMPVYKTTEIDLTGTKGSEETKYSRAVNYNQVAITWLLTGITGPDYVDRGDAGYLDDKDWGYWVKFEYGKASSLYTYRVPYIGYFDDGSTLAYSQGSHDLYYLNAIETRSHKAIFVKDLRTDGLSSYLKKNDPNFGHDTETGLSTPTPPLKLDEIFLMTKTKFNELTAMGFSSSLNYTMNNGSLYDLYDVGDIANNSSFRTFIDQNSIRRIKMVFETNNSLKLCKNTINSFPNITNPPAIDGALYSGKEGKLTLRRVQVYGKNGAKVFPDYKFEYANNPDYNVNYWDGWGYYNPSGTSSMSSHKASDVDAHGAAWSLTKIVLPTGGSVAMDYERDTYAAIAGQPVIGTKSSFSKSDYTMMNYPGPSYDVPLSNTTGFAVGDKVVIDGYIQYQCTTGGSVSNNSYSGTYTIQSLTASSINVGAPYTQINCSTGAQVYVSSNYGTVAKILPSKKGGDIRVRTLSFISEMGEAYKTKYTYMLPDNVTSSGVVSKEPELIKDTWSNPDNYGMDKVYDFPSTPILYSRVTVNSGYNKLTDDYSTKQVYSFITPDKSMVTETSVKLNDYIVPGFHYHTANDLESDKMYFKQYQHRITVNTAGIGKVKSIEFADKNDVTKEKFDFYYTNNAPNDQGKFTQGVLLSEFCTTSASFFDPHAIKLIKSTKTFLPTVLSKMVHTKDTYVDSKSYKSWDFFSGMVTVSETTTADNFRVREELLPAYTVGSYAQMGPKGLNSGNKNMLTQLAARYVYRLDASNDIAGLMNAQVTTWKSNWSNYRVYNATTGLYESKADGPAVWRNDSQYGFYGTYNDYDATDGFYKYNASNRYNFGASNPLWKKLGTTTIYDHYSAPVESYDFDQINSMVKMGYGDALPVVQAFNASYNEVAFSGAEDLQSNNYFGSEVALAQGTQGVMPASPAHTGKASVKIADATSASFVYKASALPAGKPYKIYAWSTTTSGRTYYKINNGTVVLSAAPTTATKIGSWYLISQTIPAQSSAFSVEVGVKNVDATTVYYDDFRFQPANATVKAMVYDADNYQLTYSLDNTNLSTQYQYNDNGQTARIFQESFKYGVRKVTEYSSDFRRFHIDQ
jgi:hypothetical protein